MTGGNAVHIRDWPETEGWRWSPYWPWAMLVRKALIQTDKSQLCEMKGMFLYGLCRLTVTLWDDMWSVPLHRSSKMRCWCVTVQGVQLELWSLAPQEPWPHRRRFNSQWLWLSIKHRVRNRNEVRQEAILTRQVVGQDKHMAHLLLMIDMQCICLFNTSHKIWQAVEVLKINPSPRLEGEVS